MQSPQPAKALSSSLFSHPHSDHDHVLISSTVLILLSGNNSFHFTGVRQYCNRSPACLLQRIMEWLRGGGGMSVDWRCCSGGRALAFVCVYSSNCSNVYAWCQNISSACFGLYTSHIDTHGLHRPSTTEGILYAMAVCVRSLCGSVVGRRLIHRLCVCDMHIYLIF